MADRPFTKKTRCDYCNARPSVWLFYRTRLYPSGRVARTNVASCAAHEGSASFQGWLKLKPDGELVRADA